MAMIAPHTQPDVPPPTFCQRIVALKSILLLMFLTGFIIAVPSPIIPQLQQDTFGNNMFTITGGLSAAKGLLGFIYMPLLGSFTDLYGRKWALLVLFTISVIPYALMIVVDFWSYSVANTFFGVYNAASTLLMAMTVDFLPPRAGVRTESFALVTAGFFLGISTAPFIGAYLTTYQTFLTCAVLQLVTVFVAWIILPADSGRRHHTPSLPPAHSAPSLITNDAAVTKPKSTDSDPEQAGLLSGAEETDADDINKCPFLRVVAVPEDGSRPPEEPQTPPEATAVSHVPQLQRRGATARVWEALRQFPDLRIAVGIVFWNSVAEQLFDKFLMLYLGDKLNFGPTRQAIVITILGVGGLLGLLFITGALKHWFGTLGTLRIALVANAVVCSMYCFANAEWIAMLATSFSVVGMGAFPCAAALAASSVDRHSAGIAQGLATSAQMAASGASPLIFGFLFTATQNSSLPGASFLIGAICVLVAAGMTFSLSQTMKKERHH